MFVASTASAVASLDTRDGSIAWRQVLGKDDIIGALVLVPRPASVVTLSSRGRMLRAWHALDGTLLWEKVVSDSAASAAASVLVLPDITGDGSSELAVSVGLKLQVAADNACRDGRPRQMLVSVWATLQFQRNEISEGQTHLAHFSSACVHCLPGTEAMLKDRNPFE